MPAANAVTLSSHVPFKSPPAICRPGAWQPHRVVCFVCFVFCVSVSVSVSCRGALFNVCNYFTALWAPHMHKDTHGQSIKARCEGEGGGRTCLGGSNERICEINLYYKSRHIIHLNCVCHLNLSILSALPAAWLTATHTHAYMHSSFCHAVLLARTLRIRSVCVITIDADLACGSGSQCEN